ncbi:MAG: hypothetical protein H6524_01755 [Actinobacteria bacterium]|nr:hypothetical protein [Micrococcales bacterium]MCB0902755.1 hypothetical protein [Actinomycetota bacterium]MCO5298365.1 hypothetical protein [Candidatus Nanopelagicales bacterium]MCB9427513.1 hypothetical protein [Actinomycetota bacterium]HPE11052.1 hypothetical protein [Actinomycetota bacterium]
MDPIRRTETWFAHNGLPQFVDDYNSREHIWTRAVPAMIVVLAVQLSSALWSALSSGSRVLPVFTVVVAVLALVLVGLWSKRRRGYWFAPSERVGWPVLLGFIAAGALPDAIQYGRRIEGVDITWQTLVASLLLQVLLLGVIYFVTRFALLAMVGWAVRQTVRSAGDLYTVATKALPLLLIVMIVLFINTEMWQVAGSLAGPVLWGSSGMLLIFGGLVTLDRTREQIATLRLDAPIEDIRAACARTPLAGVVAGLRQVGNADLHRPQRRAMVIAALSTQVIQAALIGLLVWAFFIVFGVVAITAPVQQAWLGDLGSADVFWTIGQDHVLSRALIRVATFLGAFAAFYTTVYAASDPVYRASFSDDVGASLQQAVDVRRAYLSVKGRQDA